jgi:hypothetical protein
MHSSPEGQVPCSAGVLVLVQVVSVVVQRLPI